MEINPSGTESYVIDAFDITEEDKILLNEHGLSVQSWCIQAGNQLEKGNNALFSHLNANLIEDKIEVVGRYMKGPKKGLPRINVIKQNIVVVNGKNRQVDHFIRIKRKDGVHKLYLESKCNLTFDTEKKGESNKKVAEVMKALGADGGGYFIPVLRTIPKELRDKYPDKTLYGVQDILDMFPDCGITCDEIFAGYRKMKNDWFAKLRSKEV